MKKLVLLAAVLLGISTANAQQMAMEQNKFGDNWSFGLKGGVVTPFKDASFFGDMRGAFGAEVRKQITPIFGLGIEGEWSVNTSYHTSSAAFDHQYLGVFGTVNFMNLFAGYKGAPRLFELELHASTGWLHSYYLKIEAPDYNSWANKLGLNFNFNLGEEKAWTVSLKPAVVWNMGTPASQNYCSYNANNAAIEVMAGITYHFKNSNGKHYMTYVRAYDQAEIDGLNTRINDLRGQLDAANAELAAANARNQQLQNDLTNCLNRKPEVIKEVIEKPYGTIRYINFGLGKSTISADQMPNVAAIAAYLKNHPEAKVEVKGYASKDGSIEINTRLANERAAAVKNTLVKKYGIAADRIIASGQGIGEMFEEESWNRVSICTIED